VRTFIKLDLPLKVFGKGFAGYGGELMKIAGNNIEFLGEISDSEKFELMRNAKAYVFAAEDEDFGITPVEVMMVGTPVITYKSGGVLETVIENISGIFFDTLKIGSLSLAITKFGTIKFDKSVIIKHAEKFSGGHFDREIKEFISKIGV
jgi:glycosyltransferase involved in cell wall biosynthesis